MGSKLGCALKEVPRPQLPDLPLPSLPLALCLPLKLRADRLHLPEAHPAAVSATHHRHPGSPTFCRCGHQQGGEVRPGATWGHGMGPKKTPVGDPAEAAHGRGHGGRVRAWF